jgi:hypothetical protein
MTYPVGVSAVFSGGVHESVTTPPVTEEAFRPIGVAGCRTAASAWTGLLIFGRRQLERVLRTYVDLCKRQRPHRALDLHAPDSIGLLMPSVCSGSITTDAFAGRSINDRLARLSGVQRMTIGEPFQRGSQVRHLAHVVVGQAWNSHGACHETARGGASDRRPHSCVVDSPTVRLSPNRSVLCRSDLNREGEAGLREKASLPAALCWGCLAEIEVGDLREGAD